MRFGRKRVLAPIVAVAAALICSACVVAVPDQPPRPVYTPPPPMPPPVIDDDYGLFYNDLDPYGDWIRMEPYGWVWNPWRVDPGWRPYTMGRWIYTEYGWFWESDEPWGWAVYHYGRWTFHPRYGWVWIPGREWAPAWVAWRYGNGWVGWAPLPPQARWRVGVGLDFGGVDIDVVIQPFWWGFVETRGFTDHRVHGRLVPPGRNVTLVRVTNHVTHYTVIQNNIVVRGVDVGEIERETRKKVAPRRIVDEGRGKGPKPQVDPQEILVFRPKIKDTPPSRAPRNAESRESASADAAEPPDRVPGGRPPRTDRADAPPRAPAPPAVEQPAPVPPVTGAPRQAPDDALRRQHAEQRELERRQAAERSRLEQLQREESRRSAPALSPGELRKRHEEELRAHQEAVAREQKVLENKQDRESKAKRKAEQPKDEAAEDPKDEPKKEAPKKRPVPGKTDKQ